VRPPTVDCTFPALLASALVRRPFLRNAAVLVLFLAMTAIAADPPTATSFIFDAAPIDAGVIPIIDKYFRSSDYLGMRVLNAHPSLRQKFDRSHQVELAHSLGEVQAVLNQGCGAGSPGTIWYVPQRGTNEFTEPVNSIVSAARKIQASGCLYAGMIPSAEFWGYVRRCEYNLATSPYQQVDWTLVDRLNIQGEGMLHATCKTGVADYEEFVNKIKTYVKSKNSKIEVYAHMSFRFAPASLIIQGIEAMTGTVDGFLLSYPLYGERIYSTPQDLEAVLKVFRRTAP
jgi:hypothetical protein